MSLTEEARAPFSLVDEINQVCAVSLIYPDVPPVVAYFGSTVLEFIYGRGSPVASTSIGE